MATLTISPTYKQHLVYEALKEKDDVFFGGGAGGGKSWLICESRLINAVRYPGYRSFIGREELKRLMQSTYITWLKVCADHGVKQGEHWSLNGQYNYIQFANGSRIDLLDLKFLPSDPFYERFGSLEYTDGAIEEAGEVNFLAYDVLKSRTGRHLNKEFGLKPSRIITGNPKKNWTYREFYKPWKNGTLPDNIAFIQSLYMDNPHTAEEYGKQLSLIKDKVMRQRLKDGNWEYDDDDNAIMTFEVITDLFTNSLEKQSEWWMTVDVARFGKDKTVVMIWNGFKVIKIIVYEKQDLETTKTKVKELSEEWHIPFSHIIADEDGVGGGVVDGLKGIKGFMGNTSPLERKNQPQQEVYKDGKVVKKTAKENYANLRSQCYYLLADEVNNHRISISTEDTKIKDFIIEELEQIKDKDIESEGKKQIIPKEEIKEAIGRSPDYADALMMRMYFNLAYTITKDIEYDRLLLRNKQTYNPRRFR